MFNEENSPDGTKIDTVIGAQTEITGDVRFKGGLHVDGTIKGNVVADDGSSSVLTVSENGVVEGEVKVPFLVIDGTVHGDVHISERIELASQARVKGNVHYKLIEMAVGAQLNGKLLHKDGAKKPPRAAGKKLETVRSEPTESKPTESKSSEGTRIKSA
ncbi:MAG: polymer-forming cytoskeletal family protein [Gammaproteobacteria bacterium]|nr:MAG: polymer-forming cytoskeletal family protein [Gammaproteobacteria bacterium]